MEKLIQFIAHRYKCVVEWGQDPKVMVNQAFGAVEMYATLHPDQYAECEELWYEWHPKFLATMKGYGAKC
jgi:hypothetical protein